MLSIYLALNNERSQQKLISFVTKDLSEKVDSKVSLNAIKWNFPNSFVLKDVYIEDQSQDTLLFINRAKVTINLLPLLQRTVSFRAIQLTEMEVYINKNDSNQYNFQFFVDAFLKEEKDSTAVQWSMDVESIAFDNCAIAFHNERQNSRMGRFNPDFVEISALKGSLYVRHFSEDSLNVKLHNIGFKELSGLELSNFSTTLIANNGNLQMHNFIASMPNSRLSLHNASFRYGTPQAFRRFMSDVFFSLEIAPSNVHLKDLAAFVPAFRSLDEKLSIEGDFNGTVNQLLIRNFALGYGNNVKVQGDFSLNGLPQLEQLNVCANIREITASSKDITTISQAFARKEVKLPALFDSLGVISYKGEIKGSLTDMQADGLIRSDAGLIGANVLVKAKDLTFSQFSVNGKVVAKSLDLTKPFGKKSQLGNSTFNLKVDLERRAKNQFSLNASGAIDSLVFRQYCYKNIALNGKFDEDGFDGSLMMTDKNIDLIFKGNIDLHREKPLFRFVAEVQNAQLANLNLLTNYPNSSLNFSIETNLVGKTVDEMEGSFSIDNLLFAYNEKEIFIDNISLTTTVLENYTKKISLYSDYINGQLTGQYQFTTILNNLHNIAYEYIPAIIKEKPEPALTREGKNDFRFRFTVNNMEFINEMIKLPFVLQDESVLSGFYNDSTNKFRVRIDASQLRVNKTIMGDFIFLCENPGDHVKVMLRSTHLPANRRRNPYFFSLNSKIKNDSIKLDVNFSNSTADTYSGALSTLVVLKELTSEGLSSDIFINPTEVILNDTVWNIHKSKITVLPQKIEVDNFYFNHKNQFLKINGSNSLTSDDDIRVRFSDLQLGYISDILNEKDITFDGVGDGDISVFGLLKKPYFKGNLNIYDASINSYLVGDLSVNTAWKETEKCIAFNAELQTQFNGKKSQSDIHGGVFIGNDSLFIEGKMKDVDLKFLRHYLGSVLQNNTGTASGTVRAYGKFGHIGLEGAPVVKNMAFDIDFLNTSYVFSDTVFMTPNSFRLNQTPVYDAEGNYGIASGLVLHEGFRNFKFAVDVSFSNLLALNTREHDNEMFYGKAYAGGKINISGTPEIINFNLDLRTRPNTRITIPIESVSTAGNADFITFVESTDNLTAAEKRRARREKIRAIQEDKSDSEINVNINLDATPDAQVQLIMDARQGDVIRATGTGNLRLSYNSRNSDFRMYGGYEIYKGEYMFTIQSIISRKFDILQGSLVQWTGSPYDAILDIRAKYALNVSPNEILEDPNMRTTLTPVHCLLGLTGTIRNPNIKFDLEFPNADEELRRQVRSVINTEEAMNRNVASLLALGHFYTADRATPSNSSSDLSSVGFSTLSSQLSSWISMIDNDLSFQMNYRPGSDGATTSSEFDVAISAPLLNDRVFVRGNFGYREDITNSPNVSNNIIDFDLEYKLNKNGKFRIKGFNRSNNSYFKQNPNTQGVGIIYREDYDNFWGLLKGYWNPVGKLLKGSPKKPEEIELKADKKDSIVIK